MPTHLGRVYLDRCYIQRNLHVLQVFDIGGDHVLEEEEEADPHVARDVFQQALDAHELQEERGISFFEPGLVRCEARKLLRGVPAASKKKSKDAPPNSFRKTLASIALMSTSCAAAL